MLPIWLAAYARGATGQIQFRAGATEWSAVVAPFADGVAYRHVIVPGWIDVGVGPEDGPGGRFWALTTNGANPLRCRYAAVFYRPTA